MTDIQVKLIELLQEIDVICKKINCSFWLARKTAETALQTGTFASNEVDVDIWMTEKDFRKFSLEVKNTKKNRQIEGININRKFPGTFYQYVAEDTLLYDLDYALNQKTHGISIRINILQEKSSSRIINLLQRNAQKVIELSHLPKRKMIGRSRKRKLMWHISGIIQRITGYHLFPAIYNYCLKKRSRGKAKSYYIERYLTGPITIPKDWFDTDTLTEFCGNEYRIPRKINELMEKDNRGIGIREKNYMIIADSKISYELYLQEIEDAKVLPTNFWKKRSKYLYKTNSMLNPIRQDIRKTWDLLFMTGERYTLWKKYMPEKDIILKFYEEEKYLELEGMLDTYLMKIREYSAKGYAICFDQDIWKIALKLLERNGEKTLADKLERQVFRDHLEPIEITGR